MSKFQITFELQRNNQQNNDNLNKQKVQIDSPINQINDEINDEKTVKLIAQAIIKAEKMAKEEKVAEEKRLKDERRKRVYQTIEYKDFSNGDWIDRNIKQSFNVLYVWWKHLCWKNGKLLFEWPENAKISVFGVLPWLVCILVEYLMYFGSIFTIYSGIITIAQLNILGGIGIVFLGLLIFGFARIIPRFAKFKVQTTTDETLLAQWSGTILEIIAIIVAIALGSN